jgi:perosamine synthetase
MPELAAPEPRAPGLIVAPDAIPRLPVFGWNALRGRAGTTKSLLDLPHLMFTTSGRASIALALEALGVGRGNTVLAPTYHCPTMIAPAVHAGADVKYFPITSTGGVDLDYLRKCDTRRVKVLLAAHYFGRPQPCADLREFCDARGIALIEDCAHTLFGESDRKPVGSWGDYAIASLTKFFPIPEGGCLVSAAHELDASKLMRRGGVLRELRAAGDILEMGVRFRRLPGLNALLGAAFTLKNRLRGAPTKPLNVPVETTEPTLDELDLTLAFSRLTSTCRWLVKTADLGRIAASRRRNYEVLVARLATLPGVRPLYPTLPEGAAPYVFPLWVEQPEARYAALKTAGVPVFRWDRRWPGTTSHPGDHGLQWSQHVFQLPCHQDLSDEDIEWLVAKLFELLAPTS